MSLRNFTILLVLRSMYICLWDFNTQTHIKDDIVIHGGNEKKGCTIGYKGKFIM